MFRLQSMISLAIVYLALTANLEPLNIMLGLFVGLFVTFLLPAPETEFHPSYWPQLIWSLIRYILLITRDLIISGVQVALIVLSRDMKIDPGIIAIPSKTKSEVATALSAHEITLTPGEFVVEIDEDGVMYTHVLNITQAEKHAEEAQEKRRKLLEKMIP